jgi:hypothetical protein
MKLTLAITALLGLMSADEVMAVARHQRYGVRYAQTYHRQREDDGP